MKKFESMKKTAILFGLMTSLVAHAEPTISKLNCEVLKEVKGKEDVILFSTFIPFDLAKGATTGKVVVNDGTYRLSFEGVASAVPFSTGTPKSTIPGYSVSVDIGMHVDQPEEIHMENFNEVTLKDFPKKKCVLTTSVRSYLGPKQTKEEREHYFSVCAIFADSVNCKLDSN